MITTQDPSGQFTTHTNERRALAHSSCVWVGGVPFAEHRQGRREGRATRQLLQHLEHHERRVAIEAARRLVEEQNAPAHGRLRHATPLSLSLSLSLFASLSLFVSAARSTRSSTGCGRGRGSRRKPFPASLWRCIELYPAARSLRVPKKVLKHTDLPRGSHRLTGGGGSSGRHTARPVNAREERERDEARLTSRS